MMYAAKRIPEKRKAEYLGRETLKGAYNFRHVVSKWKNEIKTG